ncbi:hypothetical protein AB0904_18190 [Streptomyces sp. NPDC006684]
MVASVCVCRDLEHGRVLILLPCGICQEWLALWAPGSKWRPRARTT